MDVKLVVQRNGQAAQTFQLRRNEMIIGRQKGCGVRIPSAQVSRQHCLLAFKDDLLSVEDLSSANGTYLNGRRIVRREYLRPGDLLKVGPVTMLVQYQLTQAAVGRLLQSAQEQPAAAALDDVQVLPEMGDEPEVELVLEPESDAPPLLDEPLDAPTAPPDPLEALRAIEAKSGGASAPPPTKKKSSNLPKPRTPPPAEEEEVAPPQERVKLADVSAPTAPAASFDLDDDAGDEPSPDASQILGHKNWQLPTGEDIREILAQIEKGKKKQP
jgi:pSer/pThr/pTyr-binding forkhead associated (FHA) protein